MALVKISGVWKNRDKNGKIYLTGYMGEARVVVLPNNFKEDEKHPDFIMYVDQPAQKQATEDELAEDPI